MFNFSKITVWLLAALFLAPRALAFYDPLAVPNNKVGVHILDPDEIYQAAKLVNSNGGDWGYVTVPIRSNDRDPEKWSRFFDAARRLRVIPLIRLATFPNGSPAGEWVRPTVYDLVDFANFLSDMSWPIQNRYVILFNEVNHAAEWGGQVDPASYANLLLDAQKIFKSRSADYFLLSAGLDMSAPNSASSRDALDFYRALTRLQPRWGDAVDGLAVHAYPNPAFSSSPNSSTRYGIRSFEYEIRLLGQLGLPPKPVFVTETGWPHDSPFYQTAFAAAWNHPRIAAVTPFLLFAGTGDFARFSLLDRSGSPKGSYLEIQRLSKIAASPLLADLVITAASPSFSSPPAAGLSAPFITGFSSFYDNLKRLLSLFTGQVTVGSVTIPVEIAATARQRQRGLSGRSRIPGNSGMLFVFPSPSTYSFWMKDMLFALDFIWIKDGVVVEITRAVPPPAATSGRPAVVSPSLPVDRVLEVPAGFIDKYGIKEGDLVPMKGGDSFWPILK